MENRREPGVPERVAARHQRSKFGMDVITKVCMKCGEPKPLDDYWNHPNGKFGKRPRCKSCVRNENTEHDRRREIRQPGYNRDRVRAWSAIGDNKRNRNLIGRYGITVKEYDRLLEEQDHKCAICDGEMDEGKRFAVDHDHKTGAIRGIVHVRCNTAIALFKDSPEICRRAAEYLEKSLAD